MIIIKGIVHEDNTYSLSMDFQSDPNQIVLLQLLSTSSSMQHPKSVLNEAGVAATR